MSYTVKNIRQVEDMAPQFGFDEVQEARFPYRDLDSETIGMAFHRVKPDKRQGFAHRHERAEEIYLILAGSGRMKLDDDVIDVGPLDAIRVAPAVARAFEAGADGPDRAAPPPPGHGRSARPAPAARRGNRP